ncbi:hypothetical protein C6P44_001812 [Monosporozyma unispora]|nr:hypothetical protein C6P44_001812 [Kazachstania unispora]
MQDIKRHFTEEFEHEMNANFSKNECIQPLDQTESMTSLTIPTEVTCPVIPEKTIVTEIPAKILYKGKKRKLIKRHSPCLNTEAFNIGSLMLGNIDASLKKVRNSKVQYRLENNDNQIGIILKQLDNINHRIQNDLINLICAKKTLAAAVNNDHTKEFKSSQQLHMFLESNIKYELKKMVTQLNAAQ